MCAICSLSTCWGLRPACRSLRRGWSSPLRLWPCGPFGFGNTPGCTSRWVFLPAVSMCWTSVGQRRMFVFWQPLRDARVTSVDINPAFVQAAQEAAGLLNICFVGRSRRGHARPLAVRGREFRCCSLLFRFRAPDCTGPGNCLAGGGQGSETRGPGRAHVRFRAGSPRCK